MGKSRKGSRGNKYEDSERVLKELDPEAYNEKRIALDASKKANKEAWMQKQLMKDYLSSKTVTNADAPWKVPLEMRKGPDLKVLTNGVAKMKGKTSRGGLLVAAAVGAAGALASKFMNPPKSMSKGPSTRRKGQMPLTDNSKSPTSAYMTYGEITKPVQKRGKKR